MSYRTIVCVLALAAACKSDPSSKAPPGPPAPTASTGSAAPAPGGLDDARIAAIVVAANQVDIDAGTLAAGKTHDPAVRQLADQMVTDHTAVNQAAVELVTRLGVKPVESDASRGLVAGGDANRKTLEGLDGAAFDKAYVDHEVAYHEAVIAVVDQQLIPSAHNAELKKMLVDVRPALVSHLEHARHVQAGLGGEAHASAH